MGVDRDLDGVMDGDAASPLLAIEQGLAGVVVSWPTNSWNFVLERATDPSGPAWEVDRGVRGISGGRYQVTNNVTAGELFFRLRGL